MSWSLRGTSRPSAQGPLSAEGWPAVSDDSALSEAPSSGRSELTACSRLLPLPIALDLHVAGSRSPLSSRPRIPAFRCPPAGPEWALPTQEGHSSHPARQYPRPMF
ncbi:hypothetical protein R6Z07M_016569 [Ovis aries]